MGNSILSPSCYSFEGKTPILKQSVCNDPKFSELNYSQGQFDRDSRIYLYGSKLDDLLRLSRPELFKEGYWGNFYKTRNSRNQIVHRLTKLDKKELFQAWNTDTKQTWQDQILNYLNSLSSQNFLSIEDSSLMSSLHQELDAEIRAYTIF